MTLSSQAARALFSYPFPHNVRELEQALRTATILADGRVLDLEHLPRAIRDHVPADEEALAPADRTLRDRLVDTLRANQGNVMATARAMNKAPVQIRRWCMRFKIEPGSFRPAQPRSPR